MGTLQNKILVEATWESVCGDDATITEVDAFASDFTSTVGFRMRCLHTMCDYLPTVVGESCGCSTRRDNPQIIDPYKFSRIIDASHRVPHIALDWKKEVRNIEPAKLSPARNKLLTIVTATFTAWEKLWLHAAELNYLLTADVWENENAQHWRQLNITAYEELRNCRELLDILEK